MESENWDEPASGPLNQESLRKIAWEIGEHRAGDGWTPTANHCGLAMVDPGQGFCHWRILPDWIDNVSREKGDGWRHCRLVLRLYDVSYVIFNGLNAHSIQDCSLPSICGHLFFKLPRPGTWQLAEVGFLLRSGEFLPAARSQVVQFPPTTVSGRTEHSALLVEDGLRIEEIGSPWDQERVLRERRKPKLRGRLRIAAFSFATIPTGQQGVTAQFASELAAGQCAAGHEVHLFAPAVEGFHAEREIDGVHYVPLDVGLDGTPLELAQAFGQAIERKLADLPPFDLFHRHEWMTGLSTALDSRPTILSLSSLETTRLNGNPPGELSAEIRRAERQAAEAADCLLVPEWLRPTAIEELDIGEERICGFPLEGRLSDTWSAPLDYGQVKKEIGVGPLDRLVLFVGPLEHAAGVDILLEATPSLLQRAGNLRLAFVGAGSMGGQLDYRMHQLRIAYAVRLLGHVDLPQLSRLLRSAEAVVLPSRHRVPMDDAVAELAQRSGKPVVTTHGGPAHLVRHDETGLVTYDNPGSIVWALDRILGDPAHAERMGQNARRQRDPTPSWQEVTRHYLEFCATRFPELTLTQSAG